MAVAAASSPATIAKPANKRRITIPPVVGTRWCHDRGRLTRRPARCKEFLLSIVNAPRPALKRVLPAYGAGAIELGNVAGIHAKDEDVAVGQARGAEGARNRREAPDVVP